MKFYYSLSAIVVLLCFSFGLSAQTQEEILPMSFSYPSSAISEPSLVKLSFDTSGVGIKDTRDDKVGNMPRFARSIHTDIGLLQSGTWTTLPDGSRIWQCRIYAAGALALIPCFDKFYLPAGATLHVYTGDRAEVIGAFTAENNPASGFYNTGLIHGDECMIEYYEPLEVAGQGALHLSEIGYAYRMVPKRSASRDFGGATPCEVNVNCSEGTDWQDQKNAVVRLLIKLGSEYGWCTGTLMNNENRDCAPYILSADHCYQNVNDNYTPASTADLAQWIFYFNYESPTCANPALEGTLGTHAITGCTILAASQDNGGDNGSDFALVRMNSYAHTLYHAYYAGWSNVDVTSASGVCIHQPNGDIKKISTYTTPLIPAHWGAQLIANTHWKVEWAATTNGTGVTEPGSSGSPLFNSDHLVIGHLTGGASSCAAPTNNDLYGKVAYDWTSNGVTTDRQLQTYLDPDNTGVHTLTGTYGSCPVNVGVKDIKNITQKIAVYPNPSAGIYTIKGDQNDAQLTITDALGRAVTSMVVLASSTMQVDLGAQESGIYLFHFTSGQGSIIKKVILSTNK